MKVVKCALSVLVLGALVAGSARAETAAPAVGAIERYQLGNGLRVVLAPDRVTAGVSVVVRYGVGAADDLRGYHGISHLLEHLTFRGSRHLAPLEGMLILERQGAEYNAATDLEATTYATQIGASGLESVLWLESERMAFTLDGLKPAALAVEQRVVVNEVRERGQDLSRWFERYWLHGLYGDAHPFAPGEDDVKEIQAVTLAGAQWFFQSSYRPDNAVLAIVGDFESRRARALVDKYFAGIVPVAVPRLSVVAPPPKLCGVHRVVVAHGGLFGRAARFGWPLPVTTTPAERASRLVLAEVLERRLAGLLVRDRAEVAGVRAAIDNYATHSVLSVSLGLHEQTRPEEVESVVRHEAESLSQHLLSARELQTLRSSLFSRAVFERRDGTSRAVALAAGAEPDEEARALLVVNAEGVLRAAQALAGPLLIVEISPSKRHAGETRLQREDNPCR